MDVINRRKIGRAATITLAAIGLASASPALAKKSEQPVEYGPIPSWERFKELAEQAVRMRLVDPGSATFEWPWGYNQGVLKPMLAKRVAGYYSCGLVNARNRMGGYTGNSFFLVVIDYDAVRYIEMDQTGRSMIADSCAKSSLPPVAKMADYSPDKAKLGLAYNAVPEGARVIGIFADTIAARAGIRAGMILTRVNGTSLKGMSMNDMQEILTNLPANSQIELADGAVLTVTRP